MPSCAMAGPATARSATIVKVDLILFIEFP
jgi:hypothetical protein